MPLSGLRTIRYSVCDNSLRQTGLILDFSSFTAKIHLLLSSHHYHHHHHLLPRLPTTAKSHRAANSENGPYYSIHFQSSPSNGCPLPKNSTRRSTLPTLPSLSPRSSLCSSQQCLSSLFFKTNISLSGPLPS